jgi:hypothetical protein
MDPCLATPEVADGNDHPGQAVVSFPNAAAAVGDHTLESPNHDPSNNPQAPSPPLSDYQMSYSIQRVVDAGGPGTGVSSPPGSTGVPSSSPGGNLGGGATVLAPGSAANGAPNGRPLSGACALAGPPRSRIHRGRLSRRGRIHLRGRVTPGRCASVARVQVAVARRVRHGCRFVARRGRLGPVTNCSRAIFFTARGSTHWRLSIRGHFPRGRYLALSRATDTLGRVELRRSHGNVAHFVIR